MEEIALSVFLSGFATAYFALHAYQLFRREDCLRMQRVMACIFVQWALFNLKDFLLTIHDYNDPNIQNILVLIDGTSLIGYTCLVYGDKSPDGPRCARCCGWWQRMSPSLLLMPYGAMRG